MPAGMDLHAVPPAPDTKPVELPGALLATILASTGFHLPDGSLGAPKPTPAGGPLAAVPSSSRANNNGNLVRARARPVRW